MAPVEIPLMTMTGNVGSAKSLGHIPGLETTLPLVPVGAAQIGSPIHIELEADPVITAHIVASGKKRSAIIHCTFILFPEAHHSYRGN